jgi:arginase
MSRTTSQRPDASDEKHQPISVSLIGAPVDAGASVPGCRMGPEALRVAGLADALTQFGCDVRDIGDLRGPPAPPSASPVVEGYRNLAEVQSWTRSIFEAVTAQLQDGRLPILMGGDHSLAIGSVSAVAAHCQRLGKPLRVLWFDAHADFNTCQTSPSGNLHGMPLAVLCGLGPESLTQMSDQAPALQSTQVKLIGVRSVDPVEKQLLREKGIVVHDMRYVDEVGMREVMTLALADITPDTHLHVSFDVDCLDPADAPGVGTPVRGGPSYREAQLCMEMIADTGALASLDIMELNPALDTRNQSAHLCVDLVESLFGKSTLLRWHR